MELADIEIDPAHLVLGGTLGDQHHLGLDHAGIADQAAPRLHDGLGDLVAEMPAQRAEDRLAVALELRRLAQIFRRKAAAEIDHVQRDAALGATAEDRGGRSERAVPGLDIVLLRADMERDAVREEPALVRKLQDVGRIVRLAAELARERPLGARAVAMDAADHAAAGSGARNLLDLGLAVDREQRDAQSVGRRDLALLLDRVAVGDAVRGAAGREHRLGLAHRGDVEARAEFDQELEDFGRRVGLHGVEHARVRQRLREGEVVVAHDIDVEHEAGSFILAVLQKFANACGHLDPAPIRRRGRGRA